MTTTADVPGRYDVAVDGRGFMLDEQGDQPALIHQSIRTQSEQRGGATENIGEATVNPEGFWRRSRDGWHHGAGQRYSDRSESDELRFYASQGVDVFSTRHQVSLLRDVSLAYTFGVTDTFMMLAGDRVYLRDNAVIKYVAAPLTLPWTTTTVSGTNINAGGSYNVNGMATDGANVYIAAGGNGIDLTTTGTSTASNFVTGSVAALWFAKGRLITVDTVGTGVYNPVTSGALPSALMTLPTGLAWLDVAEGSNHIYLLASDQKSRTLIYKTQIEPDGTALAVPTVAGELPYGYLGRAVFGYAGRMFLGCTDGVVMATVDGDGNLVFGSKIPYESGVGANEVGFTADSQYVFVTYPSVTGNGLMRLDLTVETLPNTPAYARDIYTTYDVGVAHSGSSVLTLSGSRRAFSLRDQRAYVESATAYVDSGYIDSGLVALDLADPKTPVSFDVEAAYPDDSSITEALSVDRGATYTDVHTWDAGDTAEAAVTGVASSRNFAIRTTLTASADNGDTPVLYRHTLKVEPSVNQGAYIICRLRLFEDVVDDTGARVGRDPSDDLAFLEALQASREVIDLQTGSLNYTVTLRDIDWQAETRTASADDGSWNGVASVRFKVVTAA